MLRYFRCRVSSVKASWTVPVLVVREIGGRGSESLGPVERVPTCHSMS